MKKLALMAFGLAVCAQAHATNNTCGPVAANGKWVMYQGAIAPSENAHVGRCELLIKEGEATGRCVMSNGLDVPVTGPVTVAKNCQVNLELGFDVPVPNGPHIDSYFDLQLSKDRQSFAGQFKNSFGVVGLSNGIKK
jgi:hypothetical protein